MNEIIIISIIYVGMSILTILVIRLLGSWMLRINDVIKELREIKDVLKKQDEQGVK